MDGIKVTHLMEFDGDVIITDPCYIIKGDSKDDWEKCECGEHMNVLGINHYIARDTLYGDWCCTVKDNYTNENIGEFCADSGMVAVFLLDEVLKYNPKFNCHTSNMWTTTWIKEFKGVIAFVIVHTEGNHEDGGSWESDNVRVIGHGVNKLTGEKIDFTSYQVGF